MTEEIQIYFELNRQSFTIDVARSVVKIWIDKYKLKGEELEQQALKLFNKGFGGHVIFTKLPYNALIIGVRANDKSGRIPSDKVYFYITCARPNLENRTLLEEYVNDAIALYYILRPNIGFGSVSSFFDDYGVPFFQERPVYPLTIFGPAKVMQIGLEKILALPSLVYEVKRLNDGGVLIRLDAMSPIYSGGGQLTDNVGAQLGLVKKDET